MSKKIDIKRTLGKSVTPLSIESVEEMTRLIHNKKPEVEPETIIPVEVTTPVTDVEQKPAPVKEKKPIATNYEKTTEQPEKSKAGRKPKLIFEPERLLRVSVDLPESVFIQLKVAVIQQKTDMKTFIRKMVEKEMEKRPK
jgi:hypothetical protein